MPSMIHNSKKVAYLHFSKTGGWFVTRMLRKQWKIIDMEKCGGHVGVKHIDENVFTFGFVRHPYDWYASLFNYFCDCNFNNGHDFSGLRSNCVNEFFEKCNREFHMQCQYQNFFGIGTQKECNQILRYEKMHSDLPILLDSLGFDFYDYIAKNKWNYVNKSKSRVGEPMSDRTKALIYESCREIFERFEYEP